MHEILNQQRGTVELLMNQIRTISDSTYYEYNAIAFMGAQLAGLIQLHDEIQTFRDGIADLVHGMLTPTLISPSEIAAAVTEMARSVLLENGRSVLCYKAPQDVYASGNFDYARHGHDLFIRLRLPYTSGSQLIAYR